jgi:hypothetical protein
MWRLSTRAEVPVSCWGTVSRADGSPLQLCLQHIPLHPLVVACLESVLGFPFALFCSGACETTPATSISLVVACISDILLCGMAG